MPLLVIPFPAIDPVAVNVGPFAVHWYALAYLAGFLGGWLYASALTRNDRLWGDMPHPTPESILDLVLYAMIGTVVGGRLGQVIFYEPGYYAGHPLEIFAIWQGGMSFHGGLIGVLLAIGCFAWRLRISALTIADLVATVCPLGIFLVRIGNFINAEHWGRPSDVPWAMVFPDAGAQPRHPSQLYEAGLEGLLLLLLLGLAVRNGAFKRPGLVTGIFLVGYALARIAMEFFREPDSQIEQLAHGLTMGMVLSLPMLAGGIALMLHSAWTPRRLEPE
ncbi:MAG TPA: prolipoprotein diacylglyceryl transferase [Xanthobacteraceae bacterium]|jgi:phosphatidylglycerol:prolipoprotein diacylglycerol transferase